MKYAFKLRRQLSRLLYLIADKLQPQEKEGFQGGNSVAKGTSEERKPKIKVNLGKSPATFAKISLLSSQIIRLYQKHPLHTHPQFWLRLGIFIGISSSAIAVGTTIYRFESSLPNSVEELLTYAPAGSLTIKSADGEILQQIGDIPHEQVKIWQYPPHVLKAFIASEDSRFEKHHGVDVQGISRAVLSNLQAGGVVEGGSTITQQLARTVFLNQERSFARKLKEMRISQKIEEKYPKSLILEKYLNLVYLGAGAYGVGDAAWVYFGKSAEQLTLAEGATLAGIVPAPSVYSPIQNQNAARERRNLVLERMQREGFITQAQAKAAIASPLIINPQQPKRLQRKAPYFTDYVLKELPKYVSQELLNRGGITVETTLNLKWQNAAEETIENTVSRYGKWQKFTQGALVAIDPRNGQIKAMVGGNDFKNHQYNRVTQAKRQPGSTFKTFVYSTAIAAGFSPNQGFLDAEYVVDGYKPENYGDSYSGNYVSMRQALASSLNVVAVKTLVDVGWNPIIKVAKKMGIESELKPTYSLALGASEVNLLELTSAYGTLANNGVHQKAYGISRVLDGKGNVLYQGKFQPEEALDKDTSAIMTWMLQGVVNGGTGQPAQIGRPVAGKTGTSDKARDLWFIGYIPQLVTGIWLGNDNNQPTWGASSMAAASWRQFMLTVVEKMPIVSFPSPPSQLDGRKKVIKPEPIKPKTSYYNLPKPKEEPVETTNENHQQNDRPRRRRGNRNRVNYNQPQARVNYPSSTRRRKSNSVNVARGNSAVKPVSTGELQGAPRDESSSVSTNLTTRESPKP